MACFEVYGPFDVPFETRGGGRVLNFKDFWNGEAEVHAGDRGCYVFAVRSGPAEKPIYVGKASKTLKQEVFNPSNRVKCQNGFSRYAKGTPVVYFVVHRTQRGKVNGTQIGEVEDFLIQNGVTRNPELQNVRGKSAPRWKISGVVRRGAGRRSHSAVAFGRLFGID